MKSRQNKTTKILIIIFAVALLIEVGYAILSSTLRINGNTKITAAGWDVHFENVQVASESVTADTAAAIAEGDNTTVNYVVTLAKPGDFYEFTVDAVNRGTIDAMISMISNTPLTETQQKYLAYNVTYVDGAAIAEKQLLAINATETLKVRVEFKKDITAADLPTTPETLPLTFSVEYVQADSTAIAIDHSVCRRATTLHTEVCNQNNSGYCSGGGYSQGETVTYGNLKTAGSPLASGDAFDCDVNGDGAFDAATERFYYVTDLASDSNYAVLVYYNNVSRGAPNNTATFEYDVDNAPRVNGPKTAILQLPTTAQWSRVNLASPTRKIKNEKNEEYVDFSYAGYAARLLTTQEIGSACGVTVGNVVTGELDACKYLFENSMYTDGSLAFGYWLENADSTRVTNAWYVDVEDRYARYNNAFDYCFGIRPAIEVLKSKISS